MKEPKFKLATILTTLCFCLLPMNFITSSAFATNTWVGGVGNWNVAGNWSNGIPNDTEEVKIITEGDLCTVNTNVGSMSSFKIAIARDATLEIDSGGYLGSGNELKVGDAGASGSGSDIGYLILKGGQLDIVGTGKLEVGYKATGEGYFTISGGSLTGDRLFVGGANAAGAKGTVTIQGSAATISMATLYVGASSSTGSNPGNGTLEFQIGSAGVSPIGLSGTAYLDPAGANSTAQLVLSLTNAPPSGQDITLITGTITGTFDTVNGYPAPEGALVRLNYGGTDYYYRLTYAGNVKLRWVSELGAVSFSVNGPTDPNYDGVPMPGVPMFMSPWMPPPTPVGAGPFPPIRLPAVPKAVGIPTFQPGDVYDYFLLGTPQFPSEAEIFQSEPNTSAGGTSNTPNGTNNQILKTAALGLFPTPVPYKHNINALSFGEDFFNGNEAPQNGIPVYPEWWIGRPASGFIEPTVAGGGLPIKLYFSVDPWAIGLSGTSVRKEVTLNGALTLPVGPIGAADVDTNPPPPPNPPYGTGPWQSDGEAAGDVFLAEPITLPGKNTLVYDEAIIALQGPVNPMEDDLDALECVGTNTLAGGIPAEPGNTHDRVAPTSGVNGGIHPPDLGDPTNPNHDPINGNPIIFSIDRESYGAPGSAVATQVFNPNEGAAADLFIAVTIQIPTGGLVTTNMLLIDEGQLGLMPHDDLDAVIVRLLIPIEELERRINDAALFYDPYNTEGSQGPGFTIPLIGPGEAVVGFSVDTSSIGLMFSAVDFECRIDGGNIPGAQPPASGVMEQAGDIFFADLQPIPGSASDGGTGITLSTNYLWFEEQTLGLDRGAWSLVAPSGDLGDLPDELNALDSQKGELPPPKPPTPYLKWSQPPIEIDPTAVTPTYYGWNEPSHREIITFECWGPTWPYQCHGDADNKKIGLFRVNQNDLAILKASLGGIYGSPTNPPYNPCADFDRNLVVDHRDLDILKYWYAKTDVPADCTPWLGGIPTTGPQYWDLFAVSLSPNGMYWNLVNGGAGGLSDPLVQPAPAGASVIDPNTLLGGVAWGFGGLNWSGSTLESNANAYSIELKNKSNYYLSVVLDNSTSPQRDTWFSSWGTIRDIVVRPWDADANTWGAPIVPTWVVSPFDPDNGTVVTSGTSSSVTLANNDFGDAELDPQSGTGIWGAAAQLPSADTNGYKVDFVTDVSTWDSYNGVDLGPKIAWKMVADDFRCLGTMPIESIHWWGSYLGWADSEPPPNPPDAWRITFWSNVAAGINAEYSYPEKLLWQIDISTDQVEVQYDGNDYFPGRPPESCFQYYVKLPRSQRFQQHKFLNQTMDDTFWVSIAAVYLVGRPVENPWGWKIRPWHWMDDAVTINIPQEPNQNTVLSPQDVMPLEYAGMSFDAAFEFDTDPNYIKYEQPYTGIRVWPHYEDEESVAIEDASGQPNIGRLVSDDWPCDTNGTISAIVWWGSYIGYRYEAYQGSQQVRPTKPDYFLLSIWIDVPMGDPGNPYPFSHPGTKIWEYKAEKYDEVMVGFDKHPEYEPPLRTEPVFRYSVRIPEPNLFWQDKANGIYWLSIVAVYRAPPPEPFYPWGWTNHKHIFQDDAVAGHQMPTGGWIWEELYDQTGVSEDMSFMLFTECLIGGKAGPKEHSDWVTWGKPDCWCYQRQCRGDIDGLKQGAFWVSLNDLAIFKTAANKPDAALPRPLGICADFDHKKQGPFRVSLNDLAIFRTYANKLEALVPVCDKPPIYTGPYNFWTSP